MAELKQYKLEMCMRPNVTPRSCAVGATWRIRLNDQTTSSLKYNIHPNLTEI